MAPVPVVPVGMDADRACATARRLHAGEKEEDGSPLLLHIARVAGMTAWEARAVAWLHEALESPGVTEQHLLGCGVDEEELRALRLLSRPIHSRSVQIYLAHVELIARAAGRSGHLARTVKVADLEDRRLHPRVRADGWSPPYELALMRLEEAQARRAYEYA
jgi:hypothetical protein